MQRVTILTTVNEVLRRELPSLGDTELVQDTPLLSTGLLDSFAMVTLLAALEQAFAISLDVERISLGQLETPSAIADLCRDALSFQPG